MQFCCIAVVVGCICREHHHCLSQCESQTHAGIKRRAWLGFPTYRFLFTCTNGRWCFGKLHVLASKASLFFFWQHKIVVTPWPRALLKFDSIFQWGFAEAVVAFLQRSLLNCYNKQLFLDFNRKITLFRQLLVTVLYFTAFSHIFLC